MRSGIIGLNKNNLFVIVSMKINNNTTKLNEKKFKMKKYLEKI